MSDIIDQVVDGLIARGALKPMPGSDHPDVKAFYATPPAPACGGLIRFHSPSLNARGTETLPSQAFLDWQWRFFTLGQRIYSPRRLFLAWMQAELPGVIRNPLASGD